MLNLLNMLQNRWVKSIMESQRLSKTVGLTMIDIKGKTFKFIDEDRSHELGHLIYDVLDIILKNPYGTLFKFKPVDFLKRKSKSADWHCVRLAVCIGLISTSIDYATTCCYTHVAFNTDSRWETTDFEKLKRTHKHKGSPCRGKVRPHQMSGNPLEYE
ncbi:hypothetical protein R6Q59_020486 [Mikania micrantha]